MEEPPSKPFLGYEPCTPERVEPYGWWVDIMMVNLAAAVARCLPANRGGTLAVAAIMAGAGLLTAFRAYRWWPAERTTRAATPPGDG